jgi:hypothetical protein
MTKKTPQLHEILAVESDPHQQGTRDPQRDHHHIHQETKPLRRLHQACGFS